MNAAVSALRFLFGVTLGRGDAEVGLTSVRRAAPACRWCSVGGGGASVGRRTGPEVSRRAQPVLRCRAQASEVVSLKVSGHRRSRMVIRIEQARAARTRYAMLSDALLEILRAGGGRAGSAT